MYRKEAVSQSLTSLVNGDVKEAVTISSNYYGGAGTLYERETISIIECILEHDFTPDPTIKAKVLAPLRVVAAAMELWGVREVQEFADVSGDWTYKLAPVDVIQLLYAAGLERHRLELMRKSGVKKVEVRARSDQPAASCQKIAGQTFPIDEVPDLPHSDAACQCSYAAQSNQKTETISPI